MGKRTRDEVIYSRVDYRVKQEFELQMKESGNKTSADFIDYLLRVNKGRQIDGTTLKQFMEVMNEVCYELKKQGININQLARNINAYPDLISMTAFEPFQRVLQLKWQMQKLRMEREFYSHVNPRHCQQL